jgi:putative FmdB family regulatory protein
MPTYEYRCENGHLFEVFQSMSDDPVTTCEVCGAPVVRVLFAPAVHFKGSGFYTTDYRKKGAKSGEDGSKSEGGDSDSKSSDSKSSDSKSSDSKSSDSSSKSDSKSESKSKD